jgi:hypothetical protein
MTPTRDVVGLLLHDDAAMVAFLDRAAAPRSRGGELRALRGPVEGSGSVDKQA